jgi:hypothetical protein
VKIRALIFAASIAAAFAPFLAAQPPLAHAGPCDNFNTLTLAQIQACGGPHNGTAGPVQAPPGTGTAPPGCTGPSPLLCPPSGYQSPNRLRIWTL